jgi:hypothetical protein
MTCHGNIVRDCTQTHPAVQERVLSNGGSATDYNIEHRVCCGDGRHEEQAGRQLLKKPTHFSVLRHSWIHLRFLSFAARHSPTSARVSLGRKPTPTPNFWVFGDRLANHTKGDSPPTDKEWPKAWQSSMTFKDRPREVSKAVLGLPLSDAKLMYAQKRSPRRKSLWAPLVNAIRLIRICGAQFGSANCVPN